MVATTFIDNAKVMAKGQVTIPKDVREILGVSSGDRITFVVENGSVRVINSAIYAMQMLQAQMDGESETAGITSDEDVMNLVKEVRAAKRGMMRVLINSKTYFLKSLHFGKFKRKVPLPQQMTPSFND